MYTEIVFTEFPLGTINFWRQLVVGTILIKVFIQYTDESFYSLYQVRLCQIT